MARAFPSIRPVKYKDFKMGAQYSGAMMGVIAPGRLAEAALGAVLPFGQLFAYCYRRFGPPNGPGDDYKEIANYLLTTPKQDVFLTVSIRPETSPRYQFGYLLSEAIHDRVRADSEKQAQTRHAAFEVWLKKKYKAQAKESVVRRAAWWEFDNDHPEQMGRDRPPGAMRSVEIALIAALGELLRPIAVRDVYFNAVGEVDAPAREAACAKPHAAAGYPLPAEFFTDPKRWVRVVDHLTDLGKGDFDRGLDTLMEKPRKPKRAPTPA